MSTLTRSRPMRRRSDAKRRAQAERIGLIHEYLREGRTECEIRPWLALAHWSGMDTGGWAWVGIANCTHRLDGLHERRKRSAGGSLTNRQNLIPACNPCNVFVEDHPDLCRRIGLVVRAGDDEYEELAA